MKERIEEAIRNAYEGEGRDVPEFYVKETDEGYTFSLRYAQEDYIDNTQLLSIVNEILRSLEGHLLRMKKGKECKKFYHVYLVPFEYEGT